MGVYRFKMCFYKNYPLNKFVVNPSKYIFETGLDKEYPQLDTLNRYLSRNRNK